MISKFELDLSKDECDKLMNWMTDQEIEFFEHLDLTSYDIEIADKVTSFIISESSAVLEIKKFLLSKKIGFKYTDITEDVLFGIITFENTDFQVYIDFYIKENLTTDLVLDKINKFGINSLTEIDKLILEEFK